MRNVWKSLILLCLVCLLLPALSARAEDEDAAQRGLEAIQSTAHWDYIQLPKAESYLGEWKTLYGRKAWYAPSLFVESVPMLKSGAPVRPFLFEGTEVTVVAEENDMSCILYRAPDNKLYSGWIQSIRLLEDFPGDLHYIGSAQEGDFDTIHETPQKWSVGWLPQTEQPYTILEQPVENCVGFTLEYQIIADNTAYKNWVLGPRTVWISDGETWTPLGCFDYPHNGTVHVEIRVPEPMTVAGIATVAHCRAPNLFDFRQIGKDFLIEK